MNHSINELINDEAVCRTAPATPGLSIRGGLLSKGGCTFLYFFVCWKPSLT